MNITALMSKQIVALFLIVLIGVCFIRTKILKEEDSRVLSKITIYISMPCVIVRSFQIDYSSEIRNGFLLAFAMGLLFHFAGLVLSKVLSKVWQFTAIEVTSIMYTNGVNLIVPLVTAVLGDKWVIYTSAFVCAQSFFLWTDGISVISGKPTFRIKNMFNPNTIAVLIGVVMFFFRLRFPAVISAAIDTSASAIGLICMLMIGMMLGSISSSEMFKRKRMYAVIAFRMLIMPLLFLLLYRYSFLSGLVADGNTILYVSLLAIMAPPATTIAQLAVLYDNEGAYASTINAICTIVSLVTIPLFTFLYML